MADDVGLPKSTLQKSIKDLVPKDMRIASEASDLLVQCCNQFVHLLSTQANDISEREKRSTITPEHVVKALEELEFGEQYIEAVKAVWEEWKVDNKEHRELKGSKKGDHSGLTQQQLVELQQKLFEEARAATLSGPLPSLAADHAIAAAPPAGAPQQQDQQQPQQQGLGAAAAGASPIPEAADGDEEEDLGDVESEEVEDELMEA